MTCLFTSTASAVQEAFKQFPELFSWITQQPDEALVKAFAKYREDLQCAGRPAPMLWLPWLFPDRQLWPFLVPITRPSPYCCPHAAPVSDEAPESLGVKEDGTPTGWITTATAVRILDDIARCEQVEPLTRLCVHPRSAVVVTRSHLTLARRHPHCCGLQVRSCGERRCR